MSRPKYDDCVAPYITQIKTWKRNGLTDLQVAQKLRIAKSTLYVYSAQHSDLKDALKEGRELADDAVENALFENCMRGNLTAQIFWLKNRRPRRWCDVPRERAEEEKAALDILIDRLVRGTEEGPKDDQ